MSRDHVKRKHSFMYGCACGHRFTGRDSTLEKEKATHKRKCENKPKNADDSRKGKRRDALLMTPDQDNALKMDFRSSKNKSARNNLEEQFKQFSEGLWPGDESNSEICTSSTSAPNSTPIVMTSTLT
jgi:hypothetical protein